jgi:hypothetical protein
MLFGVMLLKWLGVLAQRGTKHYGNQRLDTAILAGRNQNSLDFSVLSV